MKTIKLTCDFCDGQCEVTFDDENYDDLIHFCPFCGDNDVERTEKPND